MSRCEMTKDGRRCRLTVALHAGVPHVFEPGKPGRPPRSGEAAEDRLTIRATADEIRAWRRLAKSEKRTLSDWVRGLCNYEVSREV